MTEPHDDTLDCITLYAGQEAIDQVVAMEDGLEVDEDWPRDTISQSWIASNGLPVETCTPAG